MTNCGAGTGRWGQRYKEKALKNIVFSLFYFQLSFDIGFDELEFCSKRH